MNAYLTALHIYIFVTHIQTLAAIVGHNSTLF